MGVLGGAFNPPHLGHLVLAQEAAAQLGLSRVLLVPTGVPAHRRIEPEPGPEVRLSMVELAVGDDPLLAADALEVERPEPSYTSATLERLAEREPGAELVFIMGADAAAGLEGWHRPERVVELARIGVAARTGTDLEEADGALDRLGAFDRRSIVRMPEIEVSSSEIRRRVASGRPIRYLVPDAVVELIEQRGLYR